MADSQNKGLGVLFIILGSMLLILCCGKFVPQLVGAIIAVLIVNYGLALMGMPAIWVLLSDFIDMLKRKYHRR